MRRSPQTEQKETSKKEGMIERYDYTPAALYARVSRDRQDVDLSVAAQLRAPRGLRREKRILGRPQVYRALRNSSAISEEPFNRQRRPPPSTKRASALAWRMRHGRRFFLRFSAHRGESPPLRH